jgi:hypothetical protein
MMMGFAENVRRGLAAQGDLNPVGDGFVFVAPIERRSEPSRAASPFM